MWPAYPVIEYYLAASILVLSMVGMGASLTLRDFLLVAKAPQGVLLTLALQVVISPAIALGLAWLLNTPREISIGMLVVSALPGGAYSNLLTYLGRGNTALSVAATAFSTAACLATTPLVLAVFGRGLVPAHVVIPMEQIVVEIAGWLLAPLAVGMLIRRLRPGAAAVVERICIRLSVVLLVILIASSLGASRLRLGQYGWRGPVSLLLLAVSWLWATYGIARLLRFSLTDTFTLGLEVVVRNGNLGLLLAASLFPASAGRSDPLGEGVLYVVLLYTGLKLLVAASEVLASRRQIGLLFGRPRPGAEKSHRGGGGRASRQARG